MTGLHITVREATSDPETWHPRAVEHHTAEHKPPRRLRVERRRQRFRPHGTDSVGVIISSPDNRRSVQFYYEHDRDTVHSLPAYEFTDRFATLIDTRRPRARQDVRRVRPTAPGILSTIRKAA